MDTPSTLITLEAVKLEDWQAIVLSWPREEIDALAAVHGEEHVAAARAALLRKDVIAVEVRARALRAARASANMVECGAQVQARQKAVRRALTCFRGLLKRLDLDPDTVLTRMDLCDQHPNLLKLKFARLRLDLSGCFTPRGRSIKAQNVIGRMERLRSLTIAQNQSRQTPAGARNL